MLWNLKVQYRIHKSQLLASNLSQINPVHTPFYLLQISFNIILPSTPVPSKCSLSFRFPYRTPPFVSPHTRTFGLTRRPPDVEGSDENIINNNNNNNNNN